MRVDHLHGGKLLQRCAASARVQRLQAPRQRDMLAIGQEGNGVMGLDARLGW
jgi:hypothetical protein